MLQFGCWNINVFSSQKLDNVNIDKYNVFVVVETGESNTSLPGFTAMHEPDVKQKGNRGRHSGGIIEYI